MASVDMRKLDTAITYIQRIAEGCNPVNNMVAREDSVLNNPNVIRCMFFVKEILEEVKRNGGVICDAAKTSKKRKEAFPFEVLKDFQYKEDLSITHVLKQVHSLADNENVEKFNAQAVNQWLKKNGCLTVEYREEVNKEVTVPTEKGKKLGIYTEVRNISGRVYVAVIYGRKAQEFVVRNLENIMSRG